MTAVTFHFPKYRLTKQLKVPGGKTMGEATVAAQEGLAGLAEGALAAVDECLDRLNSLWENRDGCADDELLQALYDTTNRTIGLSTVTGLVEMDRAAYSLCDMLDRMAVSGRCDQNSIEVHIRALNLLRHPVTLNGAAIREILLGLGQVRDKYAKVGGAG